MNKWINRAAGAMCAIFLGVMSAALSVALLASGPAMAMPADDVASVVAAAPVADQTDGSIVVSVSGARTGSYTSTARTIADYTILNYGGSLALAEGQTITAKIQVSFNNVTWLDYVTVHNAVGAAATVTPAKTDAVGWYIRMVYTPVSSTLTYTPTFWVMAK